MDQKDVNEWAVAERLSVEWLRVEDYGEQKLVSLLSAGSSPTPPAAAVLQIPRTTASMPRLRHLPEPPSTVLVMELPRETGG